MSNLLQNMDTRTRAERAAAAKAAADAAAAAHKAELDAIFGD